MSSARELLRRVGVQGAVGRLGTELCWDLLESVSLARLAVATDDDVEIFPINYVVDGTRIYFRTGPGAKLDAIDERPRVALEIDGVDADAQAAYSVIVKGTAERLVTPADIDAAEALPLSPWTATLKLRWVRIRPSEVSGRVFRLGAERHPFL